MRIFHTADPDAGADHLPSYRVLAIIALIIMLPTLPLFAFSSGPWAYVREYWGIFWHLSMFLLIAKLPTANWSRSAGFAWVTLDVLSGMLYISGMDPTMTNAIRMSAHLFLGTWLMSSTITSSSVWIKVCGITAGAILFLYSWVSPFVPSVYLTPNAPFFLAWLALIALGRYHPRRETTSQTG